MQYVRLHYRGHELDVAGARFVVGRSSACDLVLDDALVSRQHAEFRLHDGQLSVADLNSRNGVRVNGERIDVPTVVRDGDVVSIGPHDLRVVFDEAPSPRAKRKFHSGMFDDSLVETAPALHSWELPGASGEPKRADDRQGAQQLHRMLVDLQAGKTIDLAAGTRLALKLASEASKTVWLDWVFQAFDLSRALMTEPQADEVLLVARRLHYRGSAALRSYLERLSAKPPTVTPNEPFALQRIHGMLKTLDR